MKKVVLLVVVVFSLITMISCNLEFIEEILFGGGNTYTFDSDSLSLTSEDGNKTINAPFIAEQKGSDSYSVLKEGTKGSPLEYSDSSSKDLLIVTDGEDVTINAQNSTAKHFGSAGKVDIQAIKSNSYHENGKVELIKVAQGRVVIENTTTDNTVKVANIFVASTEAIIAVHDYNAIPVITVSETITKDKTEGLGVFTVQKLKQDTQDVVVSAVGTVTSEKKVTFAGTVMENELSTLIEPIAEETLEVSADGTIMTLSAFRNSVNAGKSYQTVKLLSDIDLNGEAWTPIGTNDHPFTGIFDGQNHTISNYKVNTPTDSQAGLFGTIIGEVNSSFNVVVNSGRVKMDTLSCIWDDEAPVTSNIEETKYTAVIKNLRVSDVTITNTSDSGSNRYSGFIVGVANNAYLSNITVSKSSISGTKGVGGIVGSLNGGVAINCVTDDDVTVTATVYNVGGIAGGSNYQASGRSTAFISCINNAKVVSGGNNAAGIVGLGQNPNCTVFFDCINNGTIVSGGGSNVYAGGIVANGFYVAVISNCTNNGEIKVGENNDKTAGSIGGIMGSGCAMCYNCVNNADITCSADYLSGIYNFNAEQNLYRNLAVNCQNNGTLTNTKEYETAYDINSISGTIVISNKTFNSFDEVKDAISTHQSSASIQFKGCSFNYSKVGTVLNLIDSIEYLSSDTNFVEKINYYSNARSNLFVDVPEVIVTNLSGSAQSYSGSVQIAGDNSKVLISSEDYVQSIELLGSNTQTEVNGSVGTISLRGSSSIATMNEGSVADRVNFSGTGTFVLTNKGTISHTLPDSKQYSNEHTVSTITACNITINNYGTIEAKRNSNNICSYACLFYNGCSVVVNNYDGSSITTNGSINTLACSSAKSVVYNYYDSTGVLDRTEVKK